MAPEIRSHNTSGKIITFLKSEEFALILHNVVKKGKN